MKLWRSGIIFSAISFIGGLGNLLFQVMIGRLLDKAEFGFVGSALAFVTFLGLPVAIVSATLTHYIAHFRGTNDERRLQGLIAGSQRFLLNATIAGSIMAVLLVHPLSDFLNFPRYTITIVVLICALLNLWQSYVMTLCQGMAWFKRIAVIGLIAVAMRLAYGWFFIPKNPSSEVAISASAFMVLAYLAILYWWKDIFKKGEQISPWNREFVSYLLVCALYAIGSYFYACGDQLVAKRYFSGEDLGNYSAAAMLGRSLPMVVGPLLTVVFTSRSGRKDSQSAKDQSILLGLYAVGLACGALGLFLLKDQLVKLIFHHETPEAAAMVVPMAITMVFVGLSQAMGIWSLASRWFKLAAVHGGLGTGYWVALLIYGKTPKMLLTVMMAGSVVTFLLFCALWFLMSRKKTPAM